MRRKSAQSDTAAPAGKRRAGLDPGRKLDIIGILMMAAASLLLLALVSHSSADESASDVGFVGILKLIGGDAELQARADVTSNWLGLFGALIAHFFIQLTIGYFALAFPVLLGIWGWFIVRRRDIRALAYYTNYALLLVFLMATFVGLLRLVSWLPQPSVVWAGNIGDFMAGILARLIGTSGGIIVIFASVLVLAVVVIDYDIRVTIDRVRALFGRVASRAGETAAAVPAAVGALSQTWSDERNAADPDGEDASAPSEPPRRGRAARVSRTSLPATATLPSVPPPVPPAAARTEPRVLTLTAEQALGLTGKTPISIEWPDAAQAASAQAASAHAAGAGAATATTAAGAQASQLPAGAVIAGLPYDAVSNHDLTARRSNGVLSRESVFGASDAGRGGTAVPDPSTSASVSSGDSGRMNGGATAAGPEELRARAARRGDGSADETGGAGDASGARQERVASGQEDDAAEDADAGVLVNEHEKKAVQQAVARRMAEADGDVDTESANIRTMKEQFAYRHPGADLLDPPERRSSVTSEELKLKAELVREKLAIFGIEITSISVVPGPVVTQFELVPDSAVKISKIVSLADDLALALAARGIRIIAPIPGKSAVGIEIPNNEPEFVHFRSVVEADEFTRTRAHLPLGLGKDIKGKVAVADLAKMPHLLIAGATGSGKSVGINVMITSLLFHMKPWEVKLVMIDPKKIELAQYRGLSRHFLATCPDIDEEIVTDPANAVIALKSVELEMDKRYTKLAKAGVRHVNDYNAKVRAGELHDSELVRHYRLPYIVVVIDELADLMITAAREVEEPIARLAQLARAVGIHLIVATQRPSVDVLTGVIKANFSARVAYQTASRIDSRTILDGPGADQLLGNGDMLYLPSGSPKPERVQNAFLSTAEVERVVEWISEQRGHVRPYQLPSVKSSKKGQSREDSMETDDLLYEAARLIVRHQQGSVSLLQRRLKVGYSRAARIVDQLEIAGIVGPYDGSKAREVLVEDPDTLEEILQTL